MTESVLESLPSSCYRRNIAALRTFQPRVAEVIDSARIPRDVSPATGRDGHRTLLVPGDDGQQVWLGGSSMPTISAVETFAAFFSDGRNVALPGVLTGLEPIVVAGKMPPHTALFVVEEKALHVKLALHLYDYRALLEHGRVIFVLADDLMRTLRTLFEVHPGYDVPTRIVPVPQRTDAQLAELRRQLEKAGRVLTGVHAGVVQSCLGRIQGHAPATPAAKPCVAVLSFETRQATIGQARRIARALRGTGWPCEICVPDAPDRCHLAARLLAVERASADLVLFVNCGPGQMGSLLPVDLPTASWYLPGAGVSADVVKEAPKHHVSFASSRTLQAALRAVGLPDEGIEPCGPAADTVTFHPLGDPGETVNTSGADVAVLMDLPDDSPEAAEITLRSHVDLWRALQDVVARGIDRYRACDAAEFLEAAQRTSGVTLHDPAVSERFVMLLRSRIAPALAARVAARALTDNGLRPRLWGANWPAEGQGNDWRCGEIPAGGDELNRLFNAARIVVLPDSSLGGVQAALDALAAGAQVVFRRPDGPFEQEYPTLASVAPHLHFYRTGRELVEIVRSLPAPGEARLRRVEEIRAILAAEHSVAQRLGGIVERLRRQQGDGRDEQLSIVD